MRRKLLLLDCNYLCHRALHSTGGLSYGDALTGTVYGFLRDISTLQDRFQTPHTAFCFDLGKSCRGKILSQYKGNRKAPATEEEKAARKDFQEQVQKLRTEYLPALGFRNIFSQEEYEADDIIAAIVRSTLIQADKIIVSADQDLFQCLAPHVSMYNPNSKKLRTHDSFLQEYGVVPMDWFLVKAIAGCSSDNIPGIQGVGEKTAIKWVRGDLPEKSKAYKAIMADKAIIQRNIELVRLPYIGTKYVKMKKDKVTKRKWIEVTKKLGMKSLKRQLPLSAR